MDYTNPSPLDKISTYFHSRGNMWKRTCIEELRRGVDLYNVLATLKTAASYYGGWERKLEKLFFPK
jgi:hypothetical protein